MVPERDEASPYGEALKSLKAATGSLPVGQGNSDQFVKSERADLRFCGESAVTRVDEVSPSGETLNDVALDRATGALNY